jgi:hypothetical protein
VGLVMSPRSRRDAGGCRGRRGGRRTGTAPDPLPRSRRTAANGPAGIGLRQARSLPSATRFAQRPRRHQGRRSLPFHHPPCRPGWNRAGSRAVPPADLERPTNEGPPDRRGGQPRQSAGLARPHRRIPHAGLCRTRGHARHLRGRLVVPLGRPLTRRQPVRIDLADADQLRLANTHDRGRASVGCAGVLDGGELGSAVRGDPRLGHAEAAGDVLALVAAAGLDHVDADAGSVVAVDIALDDLER